MHDVTPNVVSKYRFVYCHNPSPFYRRAGLRELTIEPSFFVFRYLYSFFYRFNIRKNDAIFVQQQWLAKAFKERYDVNNIVVSYPTDSRNSDNNVDVRVKEFADDKIIRVIYPAVPRVFKNYEYLFQVAELVEKDGGFSFNVTIDGSENKYSKELYRKYSHLRNANFLGYQSAKMMKQAYQNSDVLCFPSMLETWGLPISEAKDYGLRIFAADLPYAHETVGKYPYASFFSPGSPKELANLLLDLRNQKNDFSFSNKGNNSDDNHSDSREIFGWDDFLKFIIYKVKND
ncbi:glycosyltransferase [Limnobaculum parvum]|uniref:Glycosyltransferase family 1 protein n=1 Tax=Limnobaculum parvum TaxID=2172103 RepID=A0A2Y9U0S5_9GAMM|nr:glycosyltransferase [Limnobaculum parvum]AWH89668.1 glycosyltransferase family 1 protein [Limnobaculum parvum]